VNIDSRDIAADFAAIDDASPDCHKEPPAPSAYSDLALSNLFVSLHGNNLRYVAKFGRWFVYDTKEGRWVEDVKMWVWTLAKRVMVSAAHEAAALVAAGDKTVSAGTVKEILSAKKVAAVISLARSHPRIAALAEWFDADAWLLNTPGGAVDLRTGLLRDARREDYFTKTTKVAPTDTPTPVFDQFLLDIMGAQILPENCHCAACAMSVGKPSDERLLEHSAEVCRLRDYILRVYGYAPTGDVSEHKLFVQIGDGGNGKGVVNDLIGPDIMGTCPTGYSTDIPIEALLEAKGERHPTELMSLWHARLAFARESDEDTRWNKGRVKRLTGKDPVKARAMRQDFVEFDATHKLIVFGNAKPNLNSPC
jgi:putative DNA primase/helicase